MVARCTFTIHFYKLYPSYQLVNNLSYRSIHQFPALFFLQGDGKKRDPGQEIAVTPVCKRLYV